MPAGYAAEQTEQCGLVEGETTWTLNESSESASGLALLGLLKRMRGICLPATSIYTMYAPRAHSSRFSTSPIRGVRSAPPHTTTPAVAMAVAPAWCSAIRSVRIVRRASWLHSRSPLRVDVPRSAVCECLCIGNVPGNRVYRVIHVHRRCSVWVNVRHISPGGSRSTV